MSDQNQYPDQKLVINEPTPELTKQTGGRRALAVVGLVATSLGLGGNLVSASAPDSVKIGGLAVECVFPNPVTGGCNDDMLGGEEVPDGGDPGPEDQPAQQQPAQQQQQPAQQQTSQQQQRPTQQQQSEQQQSGSPRQQSSAPEVEQYVPTAYDNLREYLDCSDGAAVAALEGTPDQARLQAFIDAQRDSVNKAEAAGLPNSSRWVEILEDCPVDQRWLTPEETPEWFDTEAYGRPAHVLDTIFANPEYDLSPVQSNDLGIPTQLDLNMQYLMAEADIDGV